MATAAKTSLIGAEKPLRDEEMLKDRLGPLFLRSDWITSFAVFVLVWLVYLMTLAPEVTLEDSGELVTGAFYAGIPHPPGYPVWTLYSWLWSVILPFGNPAWRVAVGQSMAASLACALLALLVSRGSSLLIRSLSPLRGIPPKQETLICSVAGLVAGLLLGLDAFMWKESVVVNRIALFSVPWLLLVLVCLLRWIYAPSRMRYAYWAAFIFGICFTTHQSLIVAALAFEVALAAGKPQMGRDAFIGNFILFALYHLNLALTHQHLFPNIGARSGLYLIFNLVGIGSLVAGVWLTMRTRGWLTEWKPVLIMAALWCIGVCAYFWLPIAGMTNPPMQWGYPRTVEGFFRALTRGQYDQPNPTNLLADPDRFLGQMRMLVTGVAEEFSWVYLLLALVPVVLCLRFPRRERSWLVTLIAMYFCLGIVLIVLLNPSLDRGSAELVKVFLTSSHTIAACFIGYGLALTAAFIAAQYDAVRRWLLVGSLLALILALVCLQDAVGKHYFGPAGAISFIELPHWIRTAFAPEQYGLGVMGALVPVFIALGLLVVWLSAKRGPVLLTLMLFSLMPLYSGLSNWFGSEQRGHWFGYWFGHDMFSPPFSRSDGRPFYPRMQNDAVLFGGTDPGRFCPTYMVFCESFTPHHAQPALDRQFDRRDVYVITQNALADPTYLSYVRAHYNRSRQVDPPFFQDLVRYALKDPPTRTNALALAVRPLDRLFTSIGAHIETRRRTSTSWFMERDFLDLKSFCDKLTTRDDLVSQYIYAQLSKETQGLLIERKEGSALPRALARDLNQIIERENSTPEKPLYTPERFKSATLPESLADFLSMNPRGTGRVRLNRLLLEAAYPTELHKSLGGVYPDREISIPSDESAQASTQEYMSDAQRRLQHDIQFPDTPKQIAPGEGVALVGDRMQVSGIGAIMAINGLVAKTIFEQNPKHEFYIEESFPIDWMYPYLTPFGVIMKINRRPVERLTEEILATDHDFWRAYASRLTGDFIDYDTSVKSITTWIEKVYLQRNFQGFPGDRRFIRDVDAQKSFSKLRSSIGGVFAWRLSPQCPSQFRPGSDIEMQRLYREADFALKQAFAFCPYSPEAVFRYADLLLRSNRLDDAMLVLDTCRKLDPFNSAVTNHLAALRQAKNSASTSKPPVDPSSLERAWTTNPANLQAAFDLVNACLAAQQTSRAIAVLESVLATNTQPEVVLAAAQAYASIPELGRLETTLGLLVKVAPQSPEAWYDLAAFKASASKSTEALLALQQAVELSARRLKVTPTARDLAKRAREDPRFDSLKSTPQYQQILLPP